MTDAIVLGAGVIGSSVAWALARRGLRVRVLERHHRPIDGLDAPSSVARATGGYRAQYGTRINTQLSLLARKTLLAFENLTGVDPHYRPCGYLFLAQNHHQLQELRDSLKVQQEAGLDVCSEVTPTQIAQLNPHLNLSDVVGGTFGPWDGFIRPLEILRGYREAAQALGTSFEYGVDTKLERHGHRVSVKAGHDTLHANAIVNAAGAWAGALMQSAGLDLPVVPERRQVASTTPTTLLPEDMPMSIFVADGFHLRVRDGRVLLLLPATPKHHNPFSLEFDQSWLEPLLARARQCVPTLNKLPIDLERCWAGLYEVSPDHHALLGQAPGLENLYLVNGSSGHGTMHSPALGQLLTEIIVDGQASSLDVHELRPERFAENDPVRGSSLL